MATAELILERAPEVRVWALAKQIPELDGVRGMAILLVMACHLAIWMPVSAARSVLDQGKIGVDLFFVLSGFLITGILLDTRERPRALRNFYVRRGLRIWPLYFASLAVAFVALRWMLPPQFSKLVYLLFLQNFFYFLDTGPVLAPLWSLAVEEQFYLVWPWIALRAKRGTVPKICCAVLALSPMIRCACRMAGASPDFIYANTLCRLDGIAIGGMIAAWVRGEEFEPTSLLRFARIALPVGILGTAACYALDGRIGFATEFRYSFVTLAFGAIVAAVLFLQGTDSALARAFRSPVLAGLGRISFAVYLFNLPVYTLLQGNHARRLLAALPAPISALAFVVFANGILIGLAICSWKFFEAPILKLKERLAPR
jgi:peptidoglycan/LPS O-acetylase OafA/YrhL